MTVRPGDTSTSRLDAAADRLLDLDSPMYGDERERRIVLEASSLGYVVAPFVLLGTGVLAAAAGAVGASVVLLLVSSVPSVVAAWYAKRRGVDFFALALRDRRLYAKVQGATLLLIALWGAALAVYGFAGHPLLPLPDVDGLFRDSGALRGGAIGAVVGGLAGGLWQDVRARRAARRAAEDDAADDEF